MYPFVFCAILSYQIRDDKLLQLVIEEIRLCCGNGALPCAAHKVAPVLFTMRARPKLSVLRLFGYFLAKVWISSSR